MLLSPSLYDENMKKVFVLFHLNMSLVIELDSPYKKCTIKTTPGMSIQSIIEESCKQFQIEPKGYSLLFKKQLIEPSLPIRLANIPHGSKLSLVFKGSKPIQKVTIALQTESDRYIDKANSNLSLFDLLLHFEQNYCLSIVKREEGGVYMMPVCVFMNREYTTIEGLKGTSLVDIGLTSGNGAIKVFGRACDKPLSNYLPLIESSGPKAVVEPVIINNLLSDTTKTQPDSKVAVLDDSTPIPKNTLKDVILPDRHSNGGSTIKHDIHVEDDKVTVEEDVYFTNKIAIELNTKIYLPPKTQASPKINLPPSFYKLTTAELKQIIDSQRSKIELNESRPLMTQKMREKEELLKAKKYPKTMIRVKFPSQIIIEMCFYSGAKGMVIINSPTSL